MAVERHGAWPSGWMVALLLFFGAGLTLVLQLAFQWYVFTHGHTIEHGADSSAFWDEKLPQHFALPVEAERVSGTEWYQPVMGYTITARFRLPETQTPQAWVEAMAHANRLADHKVSPLCYDAGGDIHRVQYLGEGLYEVCNSWD